MKQLSFILILIALVQCTWAQTNGSASPDVVRTIEHPDFTSLFTYDIEIPKVEFGEEQTTLYFDFSHYTGTSGATLSHQELQRLSVGQRVQCERRWSERNIHLLRASARGYARVRLHRRSRLAIVLPVLRHS